MPFKFVFSILITWLVEYSHSHLKLLQDSSLKTETNLSENYRGLPKYEPWAEYAVSMATLRVATTRHRDTYHPIYLPSPAKEREVREQKKATRTDGTQDKLHFLTQLASKTCTGKCCKTQNNTPSAGHPERQLAWMACIGSIQISPKLHLAT